MNWKRKLKQKLIALTGYWFYKTKYLPVGTDLFVDIEHRLSIKELRVIFDIGANTGQSYHWFREENPKAQIYCFEPVMETFTML